MKNKRKWVVKFINWKTKEADWSVLLVLLPFFALVFMVLSAYEIAYWNAKVCLFLYVTFLIIMYLTNGKYPYPTFKLIIERVI